MNGGNPKNAAALPYRRGVGAMLFNDQGRVFIGRRFSVKYPDSWQMPQGGIDRKEAPEQAVLRELAEETGIEKAEIIAETKDWLTYDLPENLLGVSWGGRFRGQKQKWFALRFTGEDADINLDFHDKPEFCEWRWARVEELQDLIVPFKRRLYKDIIEEFSGLADKITDST
jgi:putative (di)nucleoside polyphosphate hydrolase